MSRNTNQTITKMDQFRNLFAKADAEILARAGDSATLDGKACSADGKPFRGELSTTVEQGGLGGGMTGLQGKMFRMPDSQAAEADRGSVLVVCGVDYDVIDIISEGTGITGLYLRARR